MKWLSAALVVILLALLWQSHFASAEMQRLRASAEAAAAVSDSLAIIADRRSAVADSVGTALATLESIHTLTIDSLEVARQQLRFERRRQASTVDSLVEALPDSIEVVVAMALGRERAEWSAEIATLEEIIGDEREMAADLRAALDAEREARQAEHVARLAAESEADRWRALAEEAESQIKRSRIVAVAGVVAGVLVAIFGK